MACKRREEVFTYLEEYMPVGTVERDNLNFCQFLPSHWVAFTGNARNGIEGVLGEAEGKKHWHWHMHAYALRDLNQMKKTYYAYQIPSVCIYIYI